MPPGTTINVTTANGTGVSASGSGGAVTANGVTIRPAAAGATAALAQGGGAVTFDNGVVDTNSVGAAATGQRGLRAVGLGSTIGAVSATIDMTTASGTASNMVGLSAEDQATIRIENTRVLMGGGAGGTGNYGVQALGAGSRIEVVGGEISTASRGAFGVRAADGGVVALSGGTRITTTGAQNTTTLAGSHALLASGINSRITGSDVIATTSGALASAARAELGGRIDLIGGSLATTAPGTAAAPVAAARVATASRMTMSGVGSAITTQGNYNFGASISEMSSFSGADLAVSTEGTGAIGLSFDGSQGDLARLTVSTLGNAAHGIQASGASILTAEAFSVRVAGQNAVGVQALDGASITLRGGGSTIVSSGQTGNALRAQGAGSLITGQDLRLSALKNGGVGARALDGGAVRLGDTTIYASGAVNSAPGLQAATGGVLVADGGAIFVGLTLDADPGSPTYGLPVDANGDAVTDPALFTASGTTGANGVFVQNTGGQAWINVDPSTGAATGRTSTIDTYGFSGSGFVVQQAGAANSSAQAANLAVTTRGVSSPGLFVQGDSGASPGPTATFSNVTVRTFGLNGHDILAQSGATVTVRDSILVAAGGANGVRSDRGGSKVAATGVEISTLAFGGSGLNATGGAIEARDVTVLTAAGNSHGMTLSANGAAVGTLVFQDGSLATGVLLGSDPSTATFGRPIDANGAVVTDPNQYLASGGAGHGVFVATGGGRVWIDVDPSTLAPAGGASSILTLGRASEGMDIQGLDTRVATANLTVETHGELSYGMRANGGASINVLGGSIATRGVDAYGLAAFRDGTVEAAAVKIATQGIRGHGLIAFSTASRVQLTQGQVATQGDEAHGAVAWNGGDVTVTDARLAATGAGAAALFVVGDAEPATATIGRSDLTNAEGPTIAVAGSGTIRLTQATVGGSGQWLKVATIDDFAPLSQIPTDEAPPPPGDAPLALLAAPLATAGAATITASGSVLNGSAYTAPGSVSDVTLAAATTWTMTGSSNLTNLLNDASSVLYSPPTGDVAQLASYKTLDVVNYTGAAGLIGLNTYLGADGSPSDRLVIDGGKGMGTSRLTITRAGGLGALTTADGILVVDARNGATTASDLFTLTRAVVAGPYEYALLRGGVDAPDSWFLRSSLNCSFADAPRPPCPPGNNLPPTPPPDPPSPDPPTPIAPALIRSEVSLYAALPALAQLYGRATIDTLHERVGEEEQLRGRQQPDDEETLNGVWGRILAVGGRRDGDSQGIYGDRGPRVNYQLYAFQAGVDVYRHEDEDGVRDHAGVYGALGQARGKVHNWDGRLAGRDEVDAWSLGAYWTRFWETGAYLDGVVQFTWFDAKAQSERLPALKGDAKALALSLEGGKPFRQKNDWIVEPQGQLIYQHFHGGKGQDEGGPVRFDQTDSLVGRIGARVARTWSRETDSGETRLTTGWGRLNLWHEFLDQPKTTFQTEDGDLSFLADTGKNWLELNGGLTRQMSDRSALYFNAAYQWDLDGQGHAYSGKLGVRVNW